MTRLDKILAGCTGPTGTRAEMACRTELFINVQDKPRLVSFYAMDDQCIQIHRVHYGACEVYYTPPECPCCKASGWVNEGRTYLFARPGQYRVSPTPEETYLPPMLEMEDREICWEQAEFLCKCEAVTMVV